MSTPWAIVCIAAFIVFCVWLAREYAQETAWCEAHGGHFVSMYKSRLCVSADGRVLE